MICHLSLDFTRGFGTGIGCLLQELVDLTIMLWISFRD